MSGNATDEEVGPQLHDGYESRLPFEVWQDVYNELERAQKRFKRYNSPHEGWAVIKEEMDELWDEVRLKSGTPLGRYKEAMQVAATAVRYMLEVDKDGNDAA